MTYRSNADLPASVRNNLPEVAQDVYRKAFNDAYANRADNPIEEADAHNIAWAAVERLYVKEGGQWIPRGVPCNIFAISFLSCRNRVLARPPNVVRLTRIPFKLRLFPPPTAANEFAGRDARVRKFSA